MKNNSVEGYSGKDWNVPTREDEAKMHYWILGIFFVVLSLVWIIPYVVAIGTEIDTFLPGNVSSVNIYNNNDSFYMNIPEAIYSYDFEIRNSLINISGYGSGFDFKIALNNDTDAIYNITDKIGEICGGDDCYYMLINASSLTCTTDCSNNGNTITQLGDTTYMIWANTSSPVGCGGGDAYECNRAKTLATLFWGQATAVDCPADSTCQSLMNSTDAVNVSQIYSPDYRDNDKRYYLSYSYTQTSGPCNVTGTFDEPTGNIAINPWNRLWGNSGGDQIQVILNGTSLVTKVGSGTDNQIGTDQTSDETDNPNELNIYSSDGAGGGGGQMKWYLIIGSNSSITWTENNPSYCGDHYEQDYFARGIPKITNNHTWAEVDFDTQIDFSSQLTTALNNCVGDPCPIYFNVSSGLWGNMTLYSLDVDINTPPTVPTTLAPINNSIYFNVPTLTCGGATDPDGDNFTILFKGLYSSWCDCGSPGTTAWDTGSTGSGGSWDNNCVSSGSKCKMSTTGYGTAYSRARQYFINTNTLNISYVTPGSGGYSDSYIDLRIDGTSILYVNNNDCQSGCTTAFDVSQWNDASNHSIEVKMARPNEPNPGMWFEWWWDDIKINSTDGDEGILLQNTTSTTFTWTDITMGNANAWWCYTCDEFGACSDNTARRNIYQMLFTTCSPDSSSIALNLTTWDEEDDTALNSTIDSSITLSSAYDSILFSNSESNEHEHDYCLTPSNIDIYATGFVQYLPDNASYTFPRQYYFESATFNGNNTEDIKLYSLTDALSSAVTFIASRAGSAVPNILIHLQRFDAGTGLFSLVATGKTSGAGTDVIYLRLTDAFYRVIAYESPYSTDELVYDSGTTHITSSPYTMLLSGGTTGQTNDWYDTWNAFGSIAYTLTFNASGTDAFLLVADDSTGVTTSMCLKVDRYTAQSGKQNVCYDCATSSSVSISCIIPDTTSYYTAQFIANQNSDLFQAVYGYAVDLTSGVGDLIGSANGAFFTFLLVGISAFTAIWSPMASIVLALLGLGLGYGLGVLSINPTMVTLIVAIGVFIIAVMYKRRSY